MRELVLDIDRSYRTRVDPSWTIAALRGRFEAYRRREVKLIIGKEGGEVYA